ncbi:hypothetical protein K6119_13355 [Paracrocinitomix mangrovi]|uniref:hypothetical protein n=1 Tax=Paracrocinitomix mangrovi TaxID=2862509 RepID=UPI001C8EA0C6|nr:hypothetical protein [Paracrocinitomix mangrovi]UKN00718.1 hypothetical protein K6119_13355 [Paracrocinitomix mangrovi]
MMLKKFYLLFTVLLVSATVNSQTIAVGDIYTRGIDMTPEIAAKMTRIELVKLEKYVVLDQFDMASAIGTDSSFEDCYGRKCLIKLGEKLEVDQILSGSYEAIGKKIIISLKLIDVKSKKFIHTRTMEFDDQPKELPRMVEITLREMLGYPVNEETKKRLGFEEEYITSNDVGRINNSGPRFGMSAAVLGEVNRFYQKERYDGGLGIYPVVSNMGYQFEIQYIGTENFSALIEIIPNIGAMEQGYFIPSVSLLNGFRFGQAGWEFAFGPAFGIKRVKSGIYEDGQFYSSSDYNDIQYNIWYADSNNVNHLTGEVYNPYIPPAENTYKDYLRSDGWIKGNASWVMAFGRTFRAGALNIPVNMYYSGNKYGAIFGVSVGFNVTRSKSRIEQN